MKNGNTVVECIFDILFETDYVAESFFSIISKVDNYDNIIKLPLSQLPEAIRKNDPNLKNQPLYEITSDKNKDYKVTLGDNVIGIAIVDNYTSWNHSFFPQIKTLFQEVLNSKKINKIKRMGLRYVNFLVDENIFETGKIKVIINEGETVDKKLFLRVESAIDSINYNKVITNNTAYKGSSNLGSIIDIVTSNEVTISDTDNIDYIFDLINKLHEVNENKFKEVISDEYITKLGI